MALRIAVLDDYQAVALASGPWQELGPDVEVVPWQDHVADPVELTWALVLAVTRNVVVEDAAMRTGGWQHTVGRGLRGDVLGLLGLGRIGSQVAAIGRAFGMEVLAWSQNLTAERAQAAGALLVDKDDLLRRSDVVSLHLRLSERTRGLVGARELALMKRSAVLVNTSRGPLVDEQALVASLASGTVRGAALDVYDSEPVAVDSPLRSRPEVVLSPHLGYVTEQAYALFYGQAVEDVAAFLQGAPVRVLGGDGLPEPAR